MFKIIGIMLVCFSGLWLSGSLISREKEKAERTSSLARLAEEAGRAVENYSMTASEILRAMGEDLMRSCGYSLEGIPSSFSELCDNCDIPDEESRRIFSEFAKDFGKNYRGREAQKCNECAARLKERGEKLAVELSAKKKLISCVCISLSLLAVILLL